MRSEPPWSLELRYHVSLVCIQEVASTLEELWISYNLLDKLAGLEKLTQLKVSLFAIRFFQVRSLSLFCPVNHCSLLEENSVLQVLYMSNNLLSRWSEIDRLKECPTLEDVLFQVLHRVPNRFHSARNLQARFPYLGDACMKNTR